jgi:hypothetical protein
MTDIAQTVVWLIATDLVAGFAGWLLFRPRNHTRRG